MFRSYFKHYTCSFKPCKICIQIVFSALNGGNFNAFIPADLDPWPLILSWSCAFSASLLAPEFRFLTSICLILNSCSILAFTVSASSFSFSASAWILRLSVSAFSFASASAFAVSILALSISVAVLALPTSAASSSTLSFLVQRLSLYHHVQVHAHAPVLFLRVLSFSLSSLILSSVINCFSLSPEKPRALPSSIKALISFADIVAINQ